MRLSSQGRAAMVCGAVFAMLFALPWSVAAAAPGSASPALDTVNVTGNSANGAYQNINVTAQSGTSGQNATGTVSFLLGGNFLVTGPVTCLSVTGPDHGGGTATAPTDAVLNAQTNSFGIVTFLFVDNGGNGRDIMSGIPTGRTPTDCSPFSGGVTDTLTNGRAVVFDAPPRPTSKNDCKNGGYARFGFENQGQCIAFVNHQG